jgi:PST family polysaccharide transporter
MPTPSDPSPTLAAPADSAAPTTPLPEPGLARQTSKGLLWVLTNVVLGKGIAFAAFVVLGLALSKDDFGIYASAFALASFAQAFRDGGVTFLIPQRGEAEFPRIAGPIFWMAAACNLAVGAFLAAIAIPASVYFQDHRVAWILWIIALSVPLTTPATVFTAVLQMRLKFDSVSRISICSALTRNLGIIILAIAGVGPLSFVIPLLGVAAIEGVMGYRAARERPWTHRPDLRAWPDLFRASRWLILTMGAAIAVNQGAYLALGMVAPSRVVGAFFFAYQLVLQLDNVLNYPVHFVLFGAFSSIKENAKRQMAAAVRAARALSLLAAPATVGLAVVADPFERLIWAGKWAESVFAIQVIALACTWRIVFAIPNAAAQSRGLWRFQAVIMIGGGIVTIGAVLLGALINPDTDTAGFAMALATLLGIGGLYTIGMHKLGIPPRNAIGAVMRCWLIAIIAAGITAAAQHLAQGWLQSLALVTSGLGSRIGGEIAALLSLTDPARAAVQARMAISTQAAVELLLLGAAFTKLFLVGLRLGAPGTVRDALSLAPARIRPILERLLIIRAA